MSKSIQLASGVFLIVFCISRIKSEYYINGYSENGDANGHVGYLKAFIDPVNESVFPANIQLNISFTLITGSLLYSIDRNNNQLNIRLSNGFSPTFHIEFRAVTVVLSMQEMCNCTQCRYKPLMLSTRVVENQVLMQCNGHDVKNITYSSERKTNLDHPLPKFPRTNGRNSAYIWLVNYEPHPNSEQMRGCIFSVEYNKRQVHFNKSGKAISDRCETTCKNDACKTGVCYEAYTSTPVCDCSKTFGSGVTCQDDSATLNRNCNQKFQFFKLKVTWRSEEMNIFELGNERYMVRIGVEGTNLCFFYKYPQSEKVVILTDYQRNHTYGLIINFASRLSVQMINDDKKIKCNATNMDNEVFQYMVQVSGAGVIDVVYKSHEADIEWKRWTIVPSNCQYYKFPEKTSTPMTTTAVVQSVSTVDQTFSKECNAHIMNGSPTDNRAMLNVIISLVVILLIAIFVIIAMLIIIFKKLHQPKDGLRERRTDSRSLNQEEIPLKEISEVPIAVTRHY